MNIAKERRDTVDSAFETRDITVTTDGKHLYVAIVNDPQDGDPRSNGHNWGGEYFSAEMIKRMQEKDHPAFWASLIAMFDKSANFGVYLVEVQPDGSNIVVGEAEWNKPSAYIECIETHMPSSEFAMELWNNHLTAIEIIKSRESFKAGLAGHCAGLATKSDYRGLGVAARLRILTLDEMKKAGCVEAFAECTGNGSLTVFTREVAKKYRVEILKRIPYTFGSADVQFTILVVYL